MGAEYDSGLMPDDPLLVLRPFPEGMKVIYYSKEKQMATQAKVKAATFSFLVVVDEEKGEHVIMYEDLVNVGKYPANSS